MQLLDILHSFIRLSCRFMAKAARNDLLDCD
jgi:hypothetical protein